MTKETPATITNIKQPVKIFILWFMFILGVLALFWAMFVNKVGAVPGKMITQHITELCSIEEEHLQEECKKEFFNKTKQEPSWRRMQIAATLYATFAELQVSTEWKNVDEYLRNFAQYNEKAFLNYKGNKLNYIKDFQKIYQRNADIAKTLYTDEWMKNNHHLQWITPSLYNDKTTSNE